MFGFAEGPAGEDAHSAFCVSSAAIVGEWSEQDRLVAIGSGDGREGDGRAGTRGGSGGGAREFGEVAAELDGGGCRRRCCRCSGSSSGGVILSHRRGEQSQNQTDRDHSFQSIMPFDG